MSNRELSVLFDPKWFYFSWRLWKISRFSVFEDWPESSGPSFKIYGVLGCKDSGAGEPLHERTLLHPLPHEEQRSAAGLHSNSSSRYQKLYSTAVSKYSGEQFKMLVMNLRRNSSQIYVIPQYDLTAFTESYLVVWVKCCSYQIEPLEGDTTPAKFLISIILHFL